MTKSPRFNIIEHVAIELATQFYEVGRSQGLKSIHKTARHYAAHNLEKFIPHATKHLMEILNSPSASAEMKEEVYNCLMERINDPQAQQLAQASEEYALPNIDVAKLIPANALPSVIKDQRSVKDFNLPLTAFKAKRH